MVVKRVSLLRQSSRDPDSILNLGYCLGGVLLVLQISEWVSSRFSGLVPSPKRMHGGEIAMLNYYYLSMRVYVCVIVCVCGPLRRTGVPSSLYSHFTSSDPRIGSGFTMTLTVTEDG